MAGVESASGRPNRRVVGILPRARHLFHLRAIESDLHQLAVGRITGRIDRTAHSSRSGIRRHRRARVARRILYDRVHPQVFDQGHQDACPAILERTGRLQEIQLERDLVSRDPPTHERSAPFAQRDRFGFGGQTKRFAVAPDRIVAHLERRSNKKIVS